MQAALASTAALAGSVLARQRQVQQQVLRLQPQPACFVHRHRQVHRPAGDFRAHQVRCRRTPAGTGTACAGPAPRSTSSPLVQRVEHRRWPAHPGRRARPTGPRRSRARAATRTRAPRKCQTQRSSTSHSAASAGWPWLRLHDQVVRIAAFPVLLGVGLAQHVEFGGRAACAPACRSRSADASRRLAASAWRSTVSSSAAITWPSSWIAMRCGRNSISAARACIGVASVAQDVAQQHLGELVHQQRRHVDVAAEQLQVAALQRRARQQALAKAQPDRVVRRAHPRRPAAASRARLDRLARLGEQGFVQRAARRRRTRAPAPARAAAAGGAGNRR